MRVTAYALKVVLHLSHILPTARAPLEGLVLQTASIVGPAPLMATPQAPASHATLFDHFRHLLFVYLIVPISKGDESKRGCLENGHSRRP